MVEPSLNDLFLSEKVGTYSFHRSYPANYNNYVGRVDEIIDVEVTRETRINTE
ncbi:MAG: hypothetical protein ACK521_00465 [bacterium]